MIHKNVSSYACLSRMVTTRMGGGIPIKGGRIDLGHGHIQTNGTNPDYWPQPIVPIWPGVSHWSHKGEHSRTVGIINTCDSWENVRPW